VIPNCATFSIVRATLRLSPALKAIEQSAPITGE
jgi:hypothetical protein